MEKLRQQAFHKSVASDPEKGCARFAGVTVSTAI